MRLTLRTLLAYRDRVLKPAELDDMHRRVQQSPMAGNLLKRIETLVSRPQILAPPVDGKGLGADANSIAEYLDDTLHGGKIPELERICLESDVQLAELAQCHNLLSTAMATTVEVPQSLRERINRLGDPEERRRALEERPVVAEEPNQSRERVVAVKPEGREWRSESKNVRADGAHRGETTRDAAGDNSATSASRTAQKGQAVEAPMLASGGDSIKPAGLDLEGSQLAHEVPEYLRGRTSDGWRMPLAIGALITVLLLLTWQAIGSLDTVRELLATRPAPAVPAELPAELPGKDAAVGEAANGVAMNGSATNGSAAAITVPANVDAAKLDAGKDIVKEAVNSGGEVATPAVNESNQSAGSVASPADIAPPSLPHPSVGSANKSADSSNKVISDPGAAEYAFEWLPADGDATRALVLVSPAGKSAHRLAAAERMPSGSLVVVPPATRPQLDLKGGPRWSVYGPTRMRVTVGASGVVPRVEMQLGRALLSSAPSGGQVVELVTAAGTCRIQLADAGSEAAVEIQYQSIAQGPITDRSAALPFLAITATQGQVNLMPSSGSPLSLATGKSALFGGGSVGPVDIPAPPAWVAADSVRPIDLQAAEDIQRQLKAGDEAVSILTTLATNRRPETAAMAVNTLILLEQWDWLAAEKNIFTDARARSHWVVIIEQMRQLLAADPQQVSVVSQLLSASDPARGALRMSMLLGFTEAELQGDALTKLVTTLESDSVLDRILAIHQLVLLTGKDLGYQPSEINRTSVQQWRRELSSGRLKILPVGGAQP